MKRSEMVKALQDRFNTTDVDAIADLADEIIDFLEQQGMHPPTYAVSLDEDSRTHTTILMWEPEDEE
jgi:hypothetical protein